MDLDLGFMYAIVAFMAMISNIIILNRTLVSDDRELPIDRSLCILLSFFIMFSLIDGIWGLYFSRSLMINRVGLTIFSYGFHTMAAMSSFMWAGYLIHYINVEGPMKKVLSTVRWILISCQMVIVYSNIFTHKAFIITEDANYKTMGIRTLMFLLQFAYYVILGSYVLYKMLSTDKSEDNKTQYLKKYRRALVFSITPLVMGIAQLIYPDGPMYSLGFMLTGTVIYSFNVTAEREEYVRMQAASEAKSKFLFSMSHDIRTPMNAILGFTYMAQKHIDERDVVMDSLNKVGSAGQHLLSLIDNILDLARIESGKMKILPDTVRADLDTDNTVPIIQEAAKQRNVAFSYSLRNIHDGYVRCDLLHVNEIVLNILSNAVKYTNPGGSVDYTVELLEDTDEEFASYRFTVADTGIGMDKAFLPHVFEDFSREESTVKSGAKGTGLGMSIVKQLVDIMGGTITVDSELGVGTTVVICLKFSWASAEEIESVQQVKASGDLSAIAGKKVLLVEDNELNREIACEILSEFELEVDQACDGSEAVEILKKTGPDYYDLVFMDIQMPVMNGFEATKAIRAFPDPGYKDLPIVAMTANAFEEDRKNALASGMNGHLSKPIDIDELTAALLGYIAGNTDKLK